MPFIPASKDGKKYKPTVTCRIRKDLELIGKALSEFMLKIIREFAGDFCLIFMIRLGAQGFMFS